MIEIIKVKDNIITEHSFVNRELRDGEIEVSNWNGNVGDNVNLYDENWNIIPSATQSIMKSMPIEVEEVNDWQETFEEIESEPEPFTGIDGIKANGVIEEEQEDKVEEVETVFPDYTRTDEIMLMLSNIDLSSIRAIRAILSGTDSEEDYKTLKALEKQAKLLREELNVCQEN